MNIKQSKPFLKRADLEKTQNDKSKAPKRINSDELKFKDNINNDLFSHKNIFA